jgi:hypothetical protein
MLTELERDVKGGTLYMGKDLSDIGLERYPEFLRAAIESGDDSQLEPIFQSQAYSMRWGFDVENP